jgi:hypothetical protein
MSRDIFFRSDIARAMRGILRVMADPDKPDEYRRAAEDFYLALSDVLGIGEIDECGDLFDIGHLGRGGAHSVPETSVFTDGCCGKSR